MKDLLGKTKPVIVPRDNGWDGTEHSPVPTGRIDYMRREGSTWSCRVSGSAFIFLEQESGDADASYFDVLPVTNSYTLIPLHPVPRTESIIIYESPAICLL